VVHRIQGSDGIQMEASSGTPDIFALTLFLKENHHAWMGDYFWLRDQHAPNQVPYHVGADYCRDIPSQRVRQHHGEVD
jgi:hypothetical protein